MSTLWTVSVLELADKGRTLLIWICSGWRLLVTALVAVKESWTHGRSLLSWRPRHSWLIRRPGIQNVPVAGAKTQMWDELKRDSVARQVIVRTISLTTSITGWLQPIRSTAGKSFYQQSMLVSHTKSFPLKKKKEKSHPLLFGLYQLLTIDSTRGAAIVVFSQTVTSLPAVASGSSSLVQPAFSQNRTKTLDALKDGCTRPHVQVISIIPAENKFSGS